MDKVVYTAMGGAKVALRAQGINSHNLANISTVMYSISSLNEGKYRVMSASLVAAFKGEPMRNTPITVVTEDGLPSDEPINLQNPMASGGYAPESSASTGQSAKLVRDLG